LSKRDLRVEAPLTDTVGTNGPGRYIYWDNYYHDLYTNRGVLMGNWAGRDGSGIQAWSRYWFSARNSILLGYRHEKVDVKFVPNGGTINDGSIRADFWFKPDWEANAFLQYEQWRFPILAPSLQKNVTASLQITYWPKSLKHGAIIRAARGARGPVLTCPRVPCTQYVCSILINTVSQISFSCTFARSNLPNNGPSASGLTSRR
jgi:hypothetical protein